MPMRQREEIQEVLRRPTGKLIRIGILLIWVVMITLLLRREGLFPFAPDPLHVRQARVMRPSNAWMGVYMGGGTRVGFVNVSTNPDNRDGHVGVGFSLTAKLRLMLLDSPTDIFVVGTAWLPQDDSKADFDFKVRSNEHTMRVAASVSAGELDGAIYTAGEQIPFKFPVGKKLLLSGAMGTTTLNLPLLDLNQEVVVDTFDPMTFSVGKAHVKCVAEETVKVGDESLPCKVMATTLDGLTSKVWLSADEEIVKAETPFGFALRKLTQQEALAPIDAGENNNILKSMSIVSTGKTPFRGAHKMTVALRGVAPDRMPPVDEAQTAKDNVYTIAPLGPDAASSGAPPGDEYLKADPLVQAEHPRIRVLAEQIIGNESDPWKRALLIYQWVHDNLRKQSVFSVPSALEVLESREGDCNEHTVLFTAIARAAHIPARIAIGLVWSDALKGFYYHAWPEVFVGRWTWMEPTLGQSVADATHIKLLNGNIESWSLLLPYLGQLEIEVTGIE